MPWAFLNENRKCIKLTQKLWSKWLKTNEETLTENKNHYVVNHYCRFEYFISSNTDITRFNRSIEFSTYIIFKLEAFSFGSPEAFTRVPFLVNDRWHGQELYTQPREWLWRHHARRHQFRLTGLLIYWLKKETRLCGMDGLRGVVWRTKSRLPFKLRNWKYFWKYWVLGFDAQTWDKVIDFFFQSDYLSALLGSDSCDICNYVWLKWFEYLSYAYSSHALTKT